MTIDELTLEEVAILPSQQGVFSPQEVAVKDTSADVLSDDEVMSLPSMATVYDERDPRHPAYDKGKMVEETLSGISAAVKSAFPLLWAEAAISGAGVAIQEGKPIPEVLKAIPENMREYATSIIQDLATARGDSIPYEDKVYAKGFSDIWANYYEAVTGKEAPVWYSGVAGYLSLVGLSAAAPEFKAMTKKVGQSLKVEGEDIVQVIQNHNAMLKTLRGEKKEFVELMMKRGMSPKKAEHLAQEMVKQILTPNATTGQVDTGLMQAYGNWVKPPSVTAPAVKPKITKPAVTPEVGKAVVQPATTVPAVKPAVPMPAPKVSIPVPKVTAPTTDPLTERAVKAVAEGKTVETVLSDIDVVEKVWQPSNKVDIPFEGEFTEGKLLKDSFGEDPYIYETQYIDPKSLLDNLNMEGVSYQGVVNMPTTQKYIDWYKQGKVPPPVGIVKGKDSGRNVSTNRRRIIAAIEAGVDKIPAYVEIGRASDLRTAYDKAKAEVGVDTKKVDVTFEKEGDAVGKEYHETIYAVDPKTGKRIGYVQHAYYKGESAVQMIEVSPEYRRKGVGLALLNELQAQTEKPITFLGDIATKEGEALWKKFSKAEVGVETTAPAEPAAPTPPPGELPPGKTVDEVLSKVPKFKRFSYPATLLRSQNRTARLLGLGEIVEPFEKAQMGLAIEWPTRAKEVIKVVKDFKKSKIMDEKDMAVALNTSEEAPADMPEDAKTVFTFFRDMSREMLLRMNEVREAAGLEKIEGINGYFRHIIDDTVMDILAGKRTIPEDAKFLAMDKVSKKVYNPMELERTLKDDLLEYFSSDLEQVTLAMLRTGLKEIYYAVPKALLEQELRVKPMDKDMYEQMTKEEKELYDAERNAMPADVRAWLVDYIKYAVEGEQTLMDAKVNDLVKGRAIEPYLDKILGVFGRHMGERPVTDLIGKISNLPVIGTLGGINPRQLLRNKFQTLQNIALYGTKNTARSLLPVTNKTLKALKTESLFAKTYGGYERIATDTKKRVESLLMAPFQWSAKSNLSQAMNASFYWTADLIQNPKNKDFGWADPARTYTEDKDFFYPSEKEKLLFEMEYGAQTTQYGYLSMQMPEIFRYKALAPATRLLSWPMNYWFMFLPEMATRGVAGHVGYNENLKIPTTDRFNAFRYLIIAGFILTNLGYTRSFLFGTAPDATPPTLQLVMGLYNYFTTKGDSGYAKQKRAQAANDIKRSALVHIPGYLSVKDTLAFFSGEKPLSEYLFYKKSKGSGSVAGSYKS